MVGRRWWLALAWAASVDALAAKKGTGFGAPPTKKAKNAAAAAPAPPLPPLAGAAPAIEKYQVGDGPNPQFMGAFLIQDPSVSDDLVAMFRESPQLRGMVSAKGGAQPIVDTSVKDSLESSVSPFVPSDSKSPSEVAPNDARLPWRNYLRALKACTTEYIQDYPYSNAYGVWSLTSRTNIQLYPPSGGYKTYHTERTGAGQPEGSRHLVFMTYLNDVDDAGGTEFYHQNVTIQPKKGLTLIWPADWTFTHRGVPSLSQEKIITTGWFNFQ